jgi:hypothetical protein
LLRSRSAIQTLESHTVAQQANMPRGGVMWQQVAPCQLHCQAPQAAAARGVYNRAKQPAWCVNAPGCRAPTSPDHHLKWTSTTTSGLSDINGRGTGAHWTQLHCTHLPVLTAQTPHAGHLQKAGSPQYLQNHTASTATPTRTRHCINTNQPLATSLPLSWDRDQCMVHNKWQAIHTTCTCHVCCC